MVPRAQIALDATVRHIAEKVPGFAIRTKQEYATQRLIGFFLRWVFPVNREYMTRYVSTFGAKVYFPEGFIDLNPWLATKVLWHEYVHIYDGKREGRAAFSFKWLMWFSLLVPAALVTLVALVATSGPWWAYLPLPLAMVPWPSPWRRDRELRGYAMNMLIETIVRRGRMPSHNFVEWVVNQFTGPAYAFMWPFRKSMLRRLATVERDITSGALWQGNEGAPYREAIEVLAR